MSLDLLRPSLPPSNGAGRRLSALPISVAAHIVAVLVLVVVPLLATGALPQPPGERVEWSTIPAMPTVPPPSTPSRPTTAAVPTGNPNAAPVEAPSGIAPDDGLQRVTAAEDPGLRSGVVDGVADGRLPLAPAVSDVPPPPPVPAGPLRSGVRAPTKILDVRPSYPEPARAAKVEGVVIIEAVIAPDGTVRDARVLRSRPLLDAAALDAVRQWRYTPTLLNGVPVAVVITVTVNFTLR